MDARNTSARQPTRSQPTATIRYASHEPHARVIADARRWLTSTRLDRIDFDNPTLALIDGRQVVRDLLHELGIDSRRL